MSQSVAPADLLDRRSKELDAREAYIATREQLVQDNEARIQRQQRELTLLDDTILAREVILSDQTARMELQDKKYISDGINMKLAIEREAERYQKWQDKVLEAKNGLTNIKGSISERETYYKEQEALIIKQSADGNLQLRGLEYAIIEAKQIVRDLGQTKKNIIQESKMLETDLESARESFAPEIAEHEAAVLIIIHKQETERANIAAVQETLHDLNKEVTGLLIKRQQIHADVDEKLTVLDTKEREIMVKREALRVEREEMEEQRHYFSSPKSLYDL